MLLARLATKKAKPDGQFALGLLFPPNSLPLSLPLSMPHVLPASLSASFLNSPPLSLSPPISPTSHFPLPFNSPTKKNIPPSSDASEEIKAFLKDLSLSQLPGVGYKLERKLKEKSLVNCGDLWTARRESLKVNSHSICYAPYFVSLC